MAKKKTPVKPHPSLSTIEEIRDLEETLELNATMLRIFKERQQRGWLEKQLEPLRVELAKVQHEIDSKRRDAETAKADEAQMKRRIVRAKKRLALLRNKSRIEKLAKFAAEAKEIRKELADLGIEVD